ncbi:hypothetical protein DXA59_14445 [Clostridium sp. OF03-18AA]|nr:hypothetical protein [Clostridium sp. OF03-18AA]RHP67113.1 hypothetical protein DXA59_14445 [Clostridium sp. OF03-18AA]
MILEAVFNLVSGLVKLVFGWINLPDLPDSITSVIDELFALISGSVGIIGIFVDLNMVKILLPVLLIVINFDEVWKFTMFILRKIPFLGID